MFQAIRFFKLGKLVSLALLVATVAGLLPAAAGVGVEEASASHAVTVTGGIATHTGVPMSNANVSVYTASGWVTARTNASGYYSFTLAAGYSYHMRVWFPDSLGILSSDSRISCYGNPAWTGTLNAGSGGWVGWIVLQRTYLAMC
jgi:hypothetical protein